MEPSTVIIKVRLRLNKLHSQDYDNIPDWTIVEAINKAALQVMRQDLRGINILQEGDEESRIVLDDYQQFLFTKKLGGLNKNQYFESEELPDNYLYYKGLSITASNKECSKQKLYSLLTEEANVEALLRNPLTRPDFNWRETFHTLSGNKIKIYKNDFNVVSVELTYYRKPKKFDIAGYTNELSQNSTNSDLEFKDDLAEKIIDQAVSNIATGIENYNLVQVQQATIKNNP